MASVNHAPQLHASKVHRPHKSCSANKGKRLRILQLNINGLGGKIEELRDYLTQENIDVALSKKLNYVPPPRL